MNSLIYSIWHTFNFSHLTTNIVKDFIPNNSHWRCHINIFWFLFFIMIFFPHLQPLVPYLFPCPTCIIKKLNNILFKKFNPMFLSKRLVIVFLVLFFTQVHKEFCVLLCPLLVKFLCESLLSTTSWVIWNTSIPPMNLQMEMASMVLEI